MYVRPFFRKSGYLAPTPRLVRVIFPYYIFIAYSLRSKRDTGHLNTSMNFRIMHVLPIAKSEEHVDGIP